MVKVHNNGVPKNVAVNGPCGGPTPTYLDPRTKMPFPDNRPQEILPMQSYPQGHGTHVAPIYVYHFHGHARCHPPYPAKPFDIPFELVSQLTKPIVDDEGMAKHREQLRKDIEAEVAKVDPLKPKVGDVMVRGVSFLHKTINGAVV